MADGLQEAIEVLEKFIEEASRPCLLGLPGKKVEKRLSKDLSSYFTRLGNKLDPNRLGKLVDTASTATSGRYAASHLASIAVKRMQPQLMAAVKSGYLDAIDTARKHQHVQEAFNEDEPRDSHGMWTSGFNSAESVDDEPRDDHGRWTDSISPKFTKAAAKALSREKQTGIGQEDASIHHMDGPHYATVPISDLRMANDSEKYFSKSTDKYERQFATSTKAHAPVVLQRPNGKLDVIDGNHRIAAAKRLGDTHVRVAIFKPLAKESHVQEADQPFDRKDSDLLSDAVEWAEKQAGELVQGLDQTTVDSIADAVASGIENQLGADGTAREIKSILEDWATSRAFTIATTEINRAMSWATVDMLDGGYKRWILAPEACPICEDNADQGAIPVDDDFDSGDGYPPAHPNCRCAVTAARAPDNDDDEE